jgi:uncharacterized protein YndB with AHSA1/START domain
MSAEKRPYDVLIRATPEQVWDALTNPDQTERYYFGTRVESDWSPRSEVRYRDPRAEDPAASVPVEGEVLEFEPPHRLVTTFKAAFAPDTGGGDQTVSWEVQPMGENASLLTLTHDGYDPSSDPEKRIHLGWVQTYSSLKSLLETGEPLNVF